MEEGIEYFCSRIFMAGYLVGEGGKSCWGCQVGECVLGILALSELRQLTVNTSQKDLVHGSANVAFDVGQRVHRQASW